MGSFKLRLVIYFVLLALLPLAAATWAFNEIAHRGETGSADARLSTAIRVAHADFEEQTDELVDTARALANAGRVQRGFITHDRSVLLRIAREVPHSAFYSGETLLAGEEPGPLSVSRTANVLGAGGRVLGTVAVHLPFDDALIARFRKQAALEGRDRFAFVAGGRTVAPGGPGGLLQVPRQGPRYVTVTDTAYRAVGTDLVTADPRTGRPPVALVALTPKATIEAAVGDLQSLFLFFSLFALTAVGAVAYALGRTIVRSLRELADAAGSVARGTFERRVPVRGRDEFAALGRAFNDMASELEARLEELGAERERTREATARVGKVLAATHDPYTLLPVILGSIVEATAAAGGRLVVKGDEIARDGDPEAGGPPLAVPLDPSDEEVLYLTPAAGDFTDEQRELAYWLGQQASIALENARLHRLVERQANTDGLTELANRRQFEEALEGEISRAERFGGGLSLVLADLDDFKQINDRYGHQAGDDVLRAFADILRATVREIDLPARYGGEEFAVLLPQTDLEGALRLAERLRRGLAARPMTTHPEQLIGVTASFGVASFTRRETPAELFGAADDALYQAKAAGKNRVVSAEAASIVRAQD